MSTKLHSFMDIFDSVFDEGKEAIQLQKIAIPIIQRDYAQGRIDPDIDRVRSRFLDALYDALTKAPATLDFVYGDIDEKGTMTPLDGQQRLTTLFLLHWYAAKKENIPENECGFLKKFSYETRYSARYFCAELTGFEPSFERKISEEIINQAWFPLDWKKDPTISSMLVMIDAIAARFCGVEKIWEKLKAGAITFYFLPIKDMGLTDELYIKMNSRGKPLTLFEHFKAELERKIRALDGSAAQRIIYKIDRDWTDLLWKYRNSSGTADGHITDDEFLRYFKFICDVICYRYGESPQGRSSDEFDLLEQYFSRQNKDAPENIRIMEKYFDCWCDIPGYGSPSEFLESFMAYKHEPGKILIDSSRYKIDIFEECLHSYSDKTGRTRQFPLNRIVLLYAITSYLQHQEEVTEADFARRVRIINNLIQNSEDEISDRIDRNRIPAILKAVDTIILTGQIDDSAENNFNVNQLQEEKDKIEYLQEHPEDAERIFALEDHIMLKGQISILGLDHLDYSNRFVSLFTCSWDKIDCALMACGNYGQMERNKWRYQFASKSLQLAWDELFHKSANAGFERTKEILVSLLSANEAFTDGILQKIADGFTAECEEKQLFPWRYYYIKYSVFRPGSYGKLSNKDAAENPYMFAVMQTKSQWSQNTYMPYLKEADEAHLSRDDMGMRLVYGGQHIVCCNDCYVLRDNGREDEAAETLAIRQNDEGIDTEDRILCLKNYLREKGFLRG